MGEVVQNKPVKAISPDPSAGRRKVHFKCPEGKYLHINEDGKRICLRQEPLGELMGDGMKCGEGWFPCDYGNERFGIPKEQPIPPPPPPPPAQPKPAASEELKKIITGKAEYSCKTRMPYLEYEDPTLEVSVPKVEGEKEAQTKARLEEAAKKLEKTIHGCHDVKFVKIQPTPEELAKAPRVKSEIEIWTEFVSKYFKK